MWDKIISQLESPNPQIRRDGWDLLRHAVFRNLVDFGPDRVLCLEQAVLNERDPVTAQRAVAVLALAAAFRAGGPAPEAVPAAAEEAEKPLSLSEWLWAPFHEPSAVFGLLDPRHRQRDELAKITLGRFLSLREFPRTVFHLVIPDGPNLGVLACDHHYEGVCLIGRPSLYNDDTVERWTSPELRFAFPPCPRPDNLPPGKVDAVYHHIAERNGARRQYVTTEKDGKRIDYGLVQRYTINDGVRDIVVVVIAGASSLGTLAATQWATINLSQPIAPGGPPLPAPGEIDLDSRLEALVEVHAAATPFTWEWQPSQLKLLKLYVDSAQWSQPRKGWYVDAPGRITVVRDRRDPERVAAVRFDDKPAPLKGNSQMFRLLAALCRQAHAHAGVVDAARLGAASWIWVAGKPLPEPAVRRHLAVLKFRYLGEALEIDRQIVLHAPVDEVLE